MPKTINLNRGYDIRLVGEAATFLGEEKNPATFALKPSEFNDFRPKLLVREGEEVKAGTILFYDKSNESAQFASPVSGEVVEIKRGPKRVIEEYKILADKNIEFLDLGAADPSSMDREEIIQKLIDGGCWPFIRQRPFDVIADRNDKPKAIHISCFNSAPLAPDMDFIVEGYEEYFQTGLDVLKQLTQGKVHLNIHATETRNKAFTEAEGVQINKFKGPHPAGNVGIQIHHLDPINKGEIVWVIRPQDLIIIGRLFLEGKYDTERKVAITGQSVLQRKYYKLRLGANIESLVKDNVEDGNLRYISGDVLTGTKIYENGYLGYYDNQLTVIPEGDDPEFQGWLLPSYPRPTISQTFPWAFNPELKFKVNTNTHGERRSFVVTGEYERVLPMDIYPVFLLKAIMTQDFDKMEGLGIYEVAPEDMALCEFVCTSKTPVQSILREGLELMRKED